MSTDPVPWGDLPLPPELAAPDPSADAWVDRVVAEAVALADDVGMDPDAAGHMLAEAEASEPLGGGGAPPWTVTDDGSAEWAMRHVVAASAELEHLAQQAQSWQDRIAAWFDHRAKPLQAKVAFMGAHLERYAVRVREDTKGKTKTLVLPSGAVPTTATSPKVVIRDAARAYAWACEHAQDALKPRQPELQVSLLRQVVRPVQLVTEADLTFSCGHTYRRAEPDGLQLPDVGTEMECSEHGPALLGSIDVRATRWVALCTTDGKLAEGVDVDPGGVTARVVPAP